MRRYFNYEHKARGAYILTALEKYLRNGDAFFASEADAIRVCQRKYKNVSLDKLKADFDYLLESGDLVFEGSRLYLYKVQRYHRGYPQPPCLLRYQGPRQESEKAGDAHCPGRGVEHRHGEPLHWTGHLVFRGRISSTLEGGTDGGIQCGGLEAF